THSMLAFTMIGLLALHVTGALYHQFVRRDDVLQADDARHPGQRSRVMRRLFAALFFSSLLSSPAAAATWNVDHAKSRLGFIVQVSGEPFSATFNSWNADITFDPSDVAHAKASVTIDLGSEASNSPDNDDGLKGPEGFSISQFPTARFDTTGFKSRGNGDYVAAGRLTIHGGTLPLTP